MVETHESTEFSQLTAPLRGELTAHCYRMLGSVHEAEDLVQETYLRAWRAYDRFEGRATVRTWLYRIATNACLTALEGRNRRPLPTALADPSDTPESELVERGEVPWLEPAPDAKIGVTTDDPGSVVVSRESVRLALIAALQHLPARQRAVLVLRDVLRFSAAEVAGTLELSTAAVNSLLQRARAQLREVMPQEGEQSEPVGAAERAVLDRYAAAFENYDVEGIVALFRQDAVWEMPPFLNWVRGAEHIGRLIGNKCPADASGDMLMLPATANGQPAFGLYMRDPATGEHRAFHLQVLTLTPTGISHVAAFFDPRLFETFGLPPVAPAER